jgi:hypothetical protein
MAEDLRRVFGDRLEALVAYRASAGVFFASSITAGDLDALSPLVESWHREGLETPLGMTRDELHRSLDAFPLEYQAMLDRHVMIAGRNPFEGVHIAQDDLRRACEVQAKGHLIHLRQGWLEAAGHADRLADMIAGSAGPWRVLLESVARLAGRAFGTHDELAATAEALCGMPASLVHELLGLENAPERSAALVASLPAYLTASERLWVTIDEWGA